jgi:hypothetical protein
MHIMEPIYERTLMRTSMKKSRVSSQYQRGQGQLASVRSQLQLPSVTRDSARDAAFAFATSQ